MRLRRLRAGFLIFLGLALPALPAQAGVEWAWSLFGQVSVATQSQAKPASALDHLERGDELRSTGDWDGAIAEYREAIRLKPDFVEGHVILGLALASQGDLDAAIQEFREATRLKPDLAPKDIGMDRFDICGLADGTNAFEICRADFKASTWANYGAELKLIEAKLSAPAKATLEGIKALFEEFQAADGPWMYNEISGTGAATSQWDQEVLDQSNFASLIRIIVKNHGLKPRSEEELQAKDKELNSAYRDRIKTATADWDYQLKDPASKDDWPNIRKNREQYLDSAKQAERLWIKLQEPWKKLAEELYRGEMPPEAIDRAIETELREVRIQEIQCEDQCDKDFFSAPLFY